MIVRKWRKAGVVTLTCHIASVPSHKPLVGFSDAVEKAWRALKRKHRLKERDPHQLCKVSSSTEILDRKQSPSTSAPSPLVKSNTGIENHPPKSETLTIPADRPFPCSSSISPMPPASEIGRIMLKFRELEAAEVEGKKEDVYSRSYVPKKFSKQSAEYGTPKPGTLTEMRAQKASKHIAKEMLYLCEMIEEYGYRNRRTGEIQITFGKLFDVYQFISDKVVGMLLRARKHKMVSFEGEMLFQRRDEDVVITLHLTPDEIQNGYKNL